MATRYTLHLWLKWNNEKEADVVRAVNMLRAALREADMRGELGKETKNAIT